MAQGRKTGGRQAGTPNKTSAHLRQAILDAFDGAGGVEYLTRLARDEPRIFVPLLARLLPTSLAGAAPDDGEHEPIDVIRILLVEPGASAPDQREASSDRQFPRAA